MSPDAVPESTDFGLELAFELGLLWRAKTGTDTSRAASSGKHHLNSVQLAFQLLQYLGRPVVDGFDKSR
jgi:hypothetical protein